MAISTGSVAQTPVCTLCTREPFAHSESSRTSTCSPRHRRDSSGNESSQRFGLSRLAVGPACSPNACPSGDCSGDCRVDRVVRAARSQRRLSAALGTPPGPAETHRSRWETAPDAGVRRVCISRFRPVDRASAASERATPLRRPSSGVLAPSRRWRLHTDLRNPEHRSTAPTRSTESWKEV